MIDFSCAKCGKQFSLKPEFAGRTTTCSGCKSPLLVPTPVAHAPGSPVEKIAFSCAKCGMKFNVPADFAGRKTSCPTCKAALIVPTLDQTAALVPTAGRIDGPSSSLVQAQVDADVTLAGNAGTAGLPGLIGDGARYIIDKELARGGMGAVLRAIDCDIRREVAVKYLLDQTNAKNKIRFVEEAQITGQLEHPNIVPIHELGVDAQQRIFFTMKMVKGRSIAQIISMLRDQPDIAEKEYTLSRLLNIFVSICNALAYAHSRGVVHRDLKPANVMVGDFGEVYVMDWGLAKVLGRPSSAISVADDRAIPEAQSADIPSATLATSLGSGNLVTSREADADLTQAGAVMGTPVYMPPEQAAGRIDEIDERSDIYSMGAILYELLTLQAPIDKTGGFWPIVMRVGQGKIDAPEMRAPERAKAGKIPPELSAIAMKALAKEKRDRYQTIDALRKDIERFTEGRSVSAKQDTVREQAIKFVKRNKAVSFATAASVILLMVVVSVFVTINYRARVAAESHYQAYRAQVKKSLPAFVEAARLSVNRRKYDDALDQIKLALEADPVHPEALLLRGQVLLVRHDFAAARHQLEAYLRIKPADAESKRLVELCQKSEPAAPANLLLFAQVFVQQQSLAMADGILAKLGPNAFEARKKLLELYRQRIKTVWPGLETRLTMDPAGVYSLNLKNLREINDLTHLEGIPLTNLDLEHTGTRDLAPLRDMPLTLLNLNYCKEVRDLTPLRGMPLKTLKLHQCTQVNDLAPLQSMPLTTLDVGQCSVHDLAPLRGMQLTTLSLSGCREVHDLTPLQGMPITKLNLNSCAMDDLAPLRDMPLTSLSLSNCRVPDLTPLDGMNLHYIYLPASIPNPRSMDVIRSMKSLTAIDARGKSYPAAEFWRYYDAKKFKK